MKRYCLPALFATLLVWGVFSCSKQPQYADFNVIPLPQSVEAGSGSFRLDDKTVIVFPEDKEGMRRNAGFLAGYIYRMTGTRPETTTHMANSNAIVLSADLDDTNTEAYVLEVTGENIFIRGASEAGVFYGIQTLRKSIPATAKGSVSFPAVKIYDYPRFGYRGTHLDVSRHFFPADSVKRFIDILALHNVNRFHWHLTDDQGWRIEIKKHPELIAAGSMRPETVIGRNTGKYDNTPHGGYYTQDELREIVGYAQDRYITIIPEVDLPGHMQAALAAYPELGCTGGPYEVLKIWGVSDDVLCVGEDKTLGFIKDVLEEVADIFPSEYIHIGGDECPKTRWKQCGKCQRRIAELGLKADGKHTKEEKLQSYVIGYAERVLRDKGRKIIGWDEILEGGLAPNATVMSWRGTEGAVEAARMGHKAIMTPTSHMYFDYYQSMDMDREPLAFNGYVPIERVYGYEPVPAELTADEAGYIQGVQANLWTEYIPTFRHAEYMLMPRIAALSEIQWTMPEKKDYNDFLERLPALISVYEKEGYNYAKHVFNVKAEYTANALGGVLEVALSVIDDAPVFYTLDGSEPTEKSNRYTEAIKLAGSCVLKAVVIRDKKSSDVFEEQVTYNKATLKPVTMLQPINKKYEFGGKSTLVDGLAGGYNYRTGRWIAFYKNDMEAVIDLCQETSVSTAWVRNYVEIGEEILDLRKLSVAVSGDGELFTEVASENFPAADEKSEDGIFTHELTFDPVAARYVKITAVPEYKIPGWHWGDGRPAFIFIDEIGVE